MTVLSVDSILDLYERRGPDHYDEELSQLDHALQTAALAVEDDAPEPLVAAALLHDIGHLLHRDGARGASTATVDLGHEHVGARFLGPLFPPAVTGPIALHVRAKRFLAATDDSLDRRLSAGSLASLELQGGALNGPETAAFQAHPHFDDAMQLRSWDDRAKIDGLTIPPLRGYRPLLERVAGRWHR